MDKKQSGAAAAVVGALLYGGAQLMDLNDRLVALEEAHPEVAEAEAEAEAEPEPAEEPKEEEQPEKAEEEPEKKEEPVEATKEG